MRVWLVALLVSWLAAREAAAAPEVAEPMHADLVRGLDPEPGELEANVLAITPIGSAGHGLAWAPEIEWAPTRRAAFELELPFVGRELEIVKLSAQITALRFRGRRPAHGVLLTAGLPVHGDAVVQATHVLAARLGRRASLVTQIGPHLAIHGASRRMTVGLVGSASAFVALRDGSAIGLEVGAAHDTARTTLELFPQVHVHVAPHVKLQLGVGVRAALRERELTAIAGARIIIER